MGETVTELQDEIAIFDLTADQAMFLFPQIHDHLQPLLDIEGHFHTCDIIADHIRGHKKIWVAWCEKRKSVDAVFVTELRIFPRKRVCAVPYIAGRHMATWRNKFIEISERYARDAQCTAMAGAFRRGWTRVAGYQECGVLLKKELE